MQFNRYLSVASLIFYWHVFEITESSVNLALSKTTNMSSTWIEYPSSKAVDGYRDCSKGFTHTYDDRQSAWWYVDLGDVYEIKKIQIFYRNGYSGRLNGYSINITRSLSPLQTWQCYNDSDILMLPSSEPSHICRYLGRYVNMSVERLPGVTYEGYDKKGALINLCEFEVYGCPIGKYGINNCVLNCSGGCLESRCDPDNGMCNCSDGWKGDKCEVSNCEKGFYGVSCVPCPDGCTDNDCNPENGDCIGGCKQSLYGSSCNLTCPTNCYNSLCQKNSGACDSCRSGHYGSNCNLNCPGNCKDKKCKHDSGNCIECTIPFQGNRCTDYGPENSIRIVPAETKYTYIENMTVNVPITCYADCSPNCTYRWNSTDNPLVFGKIGRNKAGTYVCTAANAVGSSKVSIQLIVQYPSRIKNIRTTGSNSTIMEGQSFAIECLMDAVPIPVARWTKDNGTEFPVANILLNPSLLIIKEANCLDTGNYTCTADNRITEQSIDSRSLEIQVLCTPRIDHRVQQSKVTKVILKPGEGLNISAQYLAYPIAKVRWSLFNFTTLEHDLIVDSEAGYKIISKDFKYWQMSTLTKSGMTKVDFGTYIVEFVNTGSSASSRFIVEEAQMVSQHSSVWIIAGLSSGGLIILVIVILLMFVLLRKGYRCKRLPVQGDDPAQHIEKYEDLKTEPTTTGVYEELTDVSEIPLEDINTTNH